MYQPTDAEHYQAGISGKEPQFDVLNKDSRQNKWPIIVFADLPHEQPDPSGRLQSRNSIAEHIIELSKFVFVLVSENETLSKHEQQQCLLRSVDRANSSARKICSNRDNTTVSAITKVGCVTELVHGSAAQTTMYRVKSPND